MITRAETTKERSKLTSNLFWRLLLVFWLSLSCLSKGAVVFYILDDFKKMKNVCKISRDQNRRQTLTVSESLFGWFCSNKMPHLYPRSVTPFHWDEYQCTERICHCRTGETHVVGTRIIISPRGKLAPVQDTDDLYLSVCNSKSTTHSNGLKLFLIDSAVKDAGFESTVIHPFSPERASMYRKDVPLRIQRNSCGSYSTLNLPLGENRLLCKMQTFCLRQRNFINNLFVDSNQFDLRGRENICKISRDVFM